jgi:hypothetical protein
LELRYSSKFEYVSKLGRSVIEAFVYIFSVSSLADFLEEALLDSFTPTYICEVVNFEFMDKKKVSVTKLGSKKTHFCLIHS